MTNTWTSTIDRWLSCQDGTWIRWSSVVAVEIVAGHRSTDGYEIVFSQIGYRRTYGTFDTKEAAQDVVNQLLQKLSNDYG